MLNCFFLKPVIISLVICTPFISLGVLANEPPSLRSDIKKLDGAYQNLANEFYLATKSDRNDIVDMDLLYDEIKSLTAQNKDIEAIQLIYSNQQTLEENIDHPAIFLIAELLLNQNHLPLAKHIFTLIEQENDDSLLASIQYIFAKYHASRKHWKEVNTLLQNSIPELSSEQAPLAYLLQGAALQNLKLHRKASEVYSQIPPDSNSFLYAQLNTAIASIRQGWISDAQTKIKQLIKLETNYQQEELFQRLYLILGYALLQQEYYRDARETFRQVKLSSRYTNRALLGIGLTATSQGDYIGGLNALEILKQKNSLDLAVDESYLIIPYVYEKLQQDHALADQYTLAIEYYKTRLIELDKLLQKNYDVDNIQLDEKTNHLVIENNKFNYDQFPLILLLNNYRYLQALSKNNTAPKLAVKFDKLIIEHRQALQQTITALIEQRKQFINSYLSQSRFGLARHYDKTQESEN